MVMHDLLVPRRCVSHAERCQYLKAPDATRGLWTEYALGNPWFSEKEDDYTSSPRSVLRWWTAG
ncbi:hypothetical protein [Nonomuraea sp. NPDC049480]|uniref:hypothetical protein n=1 Tax=Nonomuraea sp. NPDC049480 TaxID=3364353 RepID=UPI0037A7E064